MQITLFEMISDLQREYIDLRQSGHCREETVRILLDRYQDELTIGVEDDAWIFWIGVADAQYTLRELSPEIAAQGLTALNQLQLSALEISSDFVQKRFDRYTRAPMPERANIPKPKRFRCKWRIGDTFAYQLTGPEAVKNGNVGGYILLRKVDELESNGCLTPVVTMTKWGNLPLPSNSTEFRKMPMLRINYKQSVNSLPIFEYRVEIAFTQKKQLEMLHLQYIGNFTDVPMPEHEHYDKRPGHVPMILPKDFPRDVQYHCHTLQKYFEENRM